MIAHKAIGSSLLFLIALSVNIPEASAKKMYKWTDEYGNVTFSDKMPPSKISGKREVLDRHARVVSIIEKDKSFAEKNVIKRLKKLASLQKPIFDKQKKKDQVLLNTYLALEDIKVSAKRQLTNLDGRRKVVNGNLQRLKDQLVQQQDVADRYKSEKKTVPKRIQDSIALSNTQIDKSSLEVVKQLEYKSKIKAKTDKEIRRFTLLSERKTDTLKVFLKPIEDKIIALGIYTCESEQSCEMAWKYAKNFIKTHSTTDVTISTDQLVMSSIPTQKDEVSLSVSKHEKEPQLLLDILCYQSQKTRKKYCSDQKIRDIKLSFNTHLKQRTQHLAANK
ncbi:MAG: DUF4124 domain-containing protein [Methylococcales bacterium]|nr:DUF4124 domain-containing protein [Methylococcales bacterium]